METRRYGVNAPDVMHETIDGEVIAINLVSGNYYSLRATSADIWALISADGPIGAYEIVDRLTARYTSPRSEIETEVGSFLAELAGEGLVAPVDSSDSPRLVAAPVDVDSKQAFEKPRLERYTDMQDLVLLDPVHQVDDTGWPRTKPDAEHDQAAARQAS